MAYDDYYPKTAQGPATKLTADEAVAAEQTGFTHPNLHTRVAPQQPPEGHVEYKPRDYKLGVHGMNSYRTTIRNIHNEETTTEEIP